MAKKRTVLGDSLPDLTDPLFTQQVKQLTFGGAFPEKAQAIEQEIASAMAAQRSAQLRTLIQPEPMPTSDTQRAARRKASARNLARRGRASTILTSYEDALGGES